MAVMVALKCAVMRPSAMRLRRSGRIQYFTRVADFGAAHDERDSGAGAGQLQGGFGRGVFGPDDDHVLHDVLVGLFVVMAYVGQVFAGHVQRVGQVEEAGGHDDVAGRDFALVGCHREVALLAVAAAAPFRRGAGSSFSARATRW